MGIELGGDWSTYSYDGSIYESDITRGLLIWNLADDVVAGAKRLGHLNPQTQESSFPFKGTAFGRQRAADQQGTVILGESAPNKASGGEGHEDHEDFPHEHFEDGVCRSASSKQEPAAAPAPVSTNPYELLTVPWRDFGVTNVSSGDAHVGTPM